MKVSKISDLLSSNLELDEWRDFDDSIKTLAGHQEGLIGLDF